MNETCGKGKGKGNGGKGEHANGKGQIGGKGAVKMVNEDDEGDEADEEKGGTRNLRWADCSDEEWEGHGGSTGGDRCEVLWTSGGVERGERGAGRTRRTRR